MTQKTTDLRPAALEGVAEEIVKGAAWVLASVATTYRFERPTDQADELAFPVAIGAAAYQLGRRPQGGMPAIARAARQVVPVEVTGLTRGELAELLAEGARSLGFEWDETDPNGPAIPKHDIPGPRRDDETVRIPGQPRGEQVTR